nr:hypothetical protein [Cylindrospermopsis raciborskii]
MSDVNSRLELHQTISQDHIQVTLTRDIDPRLTCFSDLDKFIVVSKS